jgi:exocyst complex protein 7
VVDEQEMENYLICVMALQKLLQSERALMAGIIPLQNQPKVFETVLREAMDLVVQEGDSIANRAKHCIHRRDFAAVLVVFPILKHLLNMRPDFEKTVEGCDISVREKFTSILNTLHTTVSRS